MENNELDDLIASMVQSEGLEVKGSDEEFVPNEENHPVEMEVAEVVKEVKEEAKEEEGEEKDLDDVISDLSKEYGVEVTENEVVESSLKDDKVDLDALIAEKTNGKFKSLDELNSYNPEPQFASERIKKLNELEQSGVDILDVLKYDSLKIESFDTDNVNQAIALIKQKMKLDDPDATEDEINYLVKKQYSLNEDMDEDDYKYQETLIKKTARKAKKELLEYKDKLNLPSSNAKKDEIQKQYQEQVKQWNDVVSNKLATYKEQKFSLGESENFSFAVDDSTKKEILEAATNLNQFWAGYTKPDGTTDMDKFFSDMLLMKKKEAILKSVYAQGGAKKAKEIISKLSNAKPKGASKPMKGDQNLSIAEQVLKSLNY